MAVPLATVVVPTVTVPADAVIVHVDPSVQGWPFTVVEAFVNALFGILDSVLAAPLIDLLVSVWLEAIRSTVPAAAGQAIV